jgi:hypothetical protein
MSFVGYKGYETLAYKLDYSGAYSALSECRVLLNVVPAKNQFNIIRLL